MFVHARLTGHEWPSPGCIIFRAGPPHRHHRLVRRAAPIGSSAIMMGSMLRVPKQGVESSSDFTVSLPRKPTLMIRRGRGVG